MTTVRQPSAPAARQSSSAVSVAPTITSRGGGASSSAKTRAPSCSRTPGSTEPRGSSACSPARSPSSAVTRTPSPSPSGRSCSRRWTKTSISPPQGSPISQASSSAIPYEIKRGSPPAITSAACTATSPSTQPPETEPKSSPLSETTSFEPTGRGAERLVATTVASAIRSPCASRRFISSRTPATRSAYRRPPGRRLGRHEPCGGQAPDERGRAQVQRGRPEAARVRPGRDPVHEREQPHPEIQVMRAAPEAVRQRLPVAVRDRERREQLGGDDARGDGERPVRRRPRHQQVPKRERQGRGDEQSRAGRAGEGNGGQGGGARGGRRRGDRAPP